MTSSPGAATRVWNAVAITVIWLTSLFVVALWVHGGGIRSLFAMDADTLDTLGRITGLVSANLLLYQVLLMARVPVFERGFGRGAITRMHRLVGFWSFWLLIAHLVLITLGYAFAAAINPFVQLWQLIWDYPGMLLATAGTILLIMVVVTSLRRSRHRLRYESWHLLHLYGYLGVGLAIPHMLWTGADFLGSTAATVYWWTLWAVTAAAVLVYRVLVPLVRSARHTVRVASVQRDGAKGVTVRMTGRALHRLKAAPGQYFVWRFLNGPGWTRGNPFSLAAAPDGNELVISARLVGDGTSRLTTLRRGTRVMFEGPYGDLTGERRQAHRLLMLGAGAGVAPLVALLEGERWEAGDAILVTRDSSASEALRTTAIARLVQRRGLVHYALDGPRARSGAPWLPATHEQWAGPDLLRYVAGDLAAYDVYVCGPVPWMDAVMADLQEAGVAPAAIHHESFSI
ncbi:ferredoxin reductase family protein [Microbacterium mangrovi]|nr:ferric reductase-like transmembrane domain-containing protein [Microbacterium mangrovi]